MATASSIETVRIRGRGTAFEFILDDTVSLDLLQRELRLLLDRQKGHFAGTAVSLNVGRRLLKPVELSELCSFLAQNYQIRVSRLSSSVERMEEALSMGAPAPVSLGMGSQRPAPAPSAASSSAEKLPEALVVRRTCRTGASIRHTGTVIVLGNVNPGAEIEADGDIIVIGALRGVAHAGAAGDRAAVIVALSINAAQLRIADRIAISPANETPAGRALATPEIASVQGDRIVVEPYAGGLPEDMGLDLAQVQEVNEAISRTRR